MRIKINDKIFTTIINNVTTYGLNAGASISSDHIVKFIQNNYRRRKKSLTKT